MMSELGILNKVRLALEESSFDGVVIAGADNFHYLSGAILPFMAYRTDQALLMYWQKGDEPVVFCPPEWADAIHRGGWLKNIVPVSVCGSDFSALSEALAEHIGNVKNIGVDKKRIPFSLFAQLKAAVPSVEWMSCDQWICSLRAVKTAEEIELLERAAYYTDHGINGAIHHVTVDKRVTSLTMAEELRVHTRERGVTLVGYHGSSHATAGEENCKYWSNPPKIGFSPPIDLKPREMVRLKIQTCLEGYWSDATRIMTMGEPTPDQVEAYNVLVQLRDAALSTIRPGVRCSEVYAAVIAAAKDAPVQLVNEMEVGHSIGVSPEEAPYFSPIDDTLLEPGMVMIIDPVVKDRTGQIWRSKDTVLITSEGCRIIGWYKDWREPYIPIASI
jgi:Xaa-Pro dipeptidase